MIYVVELPSTDDECRGGGELVYEVGCLVFLKKRMENLKLNCSTCGKHYEKPIDFQKWNSERPNVFFKWSLTYCDDCRRAKEFEMLKALPKVINALV